MRVIYKYSIFESGTKITAPIDEILDIQYQDGIAVMWAIVDDERFVPTEITVTALPTGLPFGENPGIYFKTLQDMFGYVWHFFIKMEAKKANGNN